jgi:hypothetical protein
MFISILYMFRATMCPSSEEITVLIRRLVFVTLKQVNSVKLQGLMLENEKCYLHVLDKISLKFLCKLYYYSSDLFFGFCVCTTFGRV